MKRLESATIDARCDPRLAAFLQLALLNVKAVTVIITFDGSPPRELPDGCAARTFLPNAIIADVTPYGLLSLLNKDGFPSLKYIEPSERMTNE